MLSIRGEDLRALALMFDTSLERLTEKLVAWGVLAPGSIGHGLDWGPLPARPREVPRPLASDVPRSLAAG